MKCPYCNYEDGWSNEVMETVKGSEGGFFTLSNKVTMERGKSYGYGTENRNLFGCPECSRLFMES